MAIFPYVPAFAPTAFIIPQIGAGSERAKIVFAGVTRAGVSHFFGGGVVLMKGEVYFDSGGHELMLTSVRLNILTFDFMKEMMQTKNTDSYIATK